jgi:hypothetical protein
LRSINPPTFDHEIVARIASSALGRERSHQPGEIDYRITAAGRAAL